MFCFGLCRFSFALLWFVWFDFSFFVFPRRWRGQEKKVERLQEKRGEQKEFMKSVVQRVLGEFIDAGRLGKAELDTAAQEVLEKMEAKVRRGGD